MEDFKREIDKVISGEISSTSSSILISPHEIDSYLISEGLEQGNLDTNGWDWDFWMDYSKDDKKYILSGSGWYNRGLSFSLADEDEY
jgi:hypothetical protein